MLGKRRVWPFILEVRMARLTSMVSAFGVSRIALGISSFSSFFSDDGDEAEDESRESGHQSYFLKIPERWSCSRMPDRGGL